MTELLYGVEGLYTERANAAVCGVTCNRRLLTEIYQQEWRSFSHRLVLADKYVILTVAITLRCRS